MQSDGEEGGEVVGQTDLGAGVEEGDPDVDELVEEREGEV